MSTLTREVSPHLSKGTNPLRVGLALEPHRFAAVRRELLLRHCKWDPQVGDVSTLAPFPLLITSDSWQELATLSEALTSELIAAENELLHREDLFGRLAIPRALRHVLRRARQIGATAASVRVMRFDFHWTASGWKISEVNADVPGGFSEASEFPRLMSEHYPSTSPTGDPARQCAHRIAQAANDRPVALLAAAGFMEDQQVVAYLAGALRRLDVEAHLAGPLQLEWRSGAAYLHGKPLGAIVRFYQAEWLSQLPRGSQWQWLLAGGRTPVSNPLPCIFGESKRFPLVWDHLRTILPTWKTLLPETRDPRDVAWRKDDSWLLKTAWCNTGDTVSALGLTDTRQWRRAVWSASLYPRHWIAQRRFKPVPLESPMGKIYPCVGVYTIDGRACGAYTRVSTRPVIDHRSTDAALLITEAEHES